MHFLTYFEHIAGTSVPVNDCSKTALNRRAQIHNVRVCLIDGTRWYVLVHESNLTLDVPRSLLLHSSHMHRVYWCR